MDEDCSMRVVKPSENSRFGKDKDVGKRIGDQLACASRTDVLNNERTAGLLKLRLRLVGLVLRSALHWSL